MDRKQLYLIRHAKSDWSVPGLRDLDRPLNKRGQRDAPMMARLMKEEGVQPDRIYSSPALRAMTTARVFSDILDLHEDSIQTDMIIYGGDAADILSIIQTNNHKDKIVFLFGHNPDITSLAEKLTGGIFHNIPTCGIVAINFPDFESWNDIKYGCGETIFFKYPKMYKNI